MTTLIVLTVLCAACAGVIGGVFFAFSVFIMRALADLPPEQGVAAMQRINVRVITPWFLVIFLGAVPLLALAAVMAFRDAASHASVWLLVAFLIYTVGSVGVTMVFNVPRTNRLAALVADSSEANAYWPGYVKEWLRWNHVRTVSSVLAAAACVLAVAV